MTEWGHMTAKKWNIQRGFQELRRNAMDMVCRHNYQLEQGFTQKPRDCYPGHIQVCWFLNGQDRIAGAGFTNVVHNGDWVFQTLVMLEMTPQQGDVYTCHVEHSSLDRTVTVEWKAQLASAKSKILARVGALYWGSGPFTASFIFHIRSQ
ncbi:Hla Class Ii Histocompatibility Antigen, Dp Beta 1 Chain [Manis pentadactyla]|nr:Hla Class Ii Histocompatibility Antigen, Dp Beta 1 Chain [Manis pentadactyla]